MFDLVFSLIWMFFGSIFIGVFFNASNFLAYRFNHVYFSMTLLYTAVFMASNMCVLESIMHGRYNGFGCCNWIAIIVFLAMSTVTVCFMRQQKMVDDNQWLRRMITQHSTALTTSYKIKESSQSFKIRQLATNIINTQQFEIELMKKLLKENMDNKNKNKSR